MFASSTEEPSTLIVDLPSSHSPSCNPIHPSTPLVPLLLLQVNRAICRHRSREMGSSLRINVEAPLRIQSITDVSPLELTEQYVDKDLVRWDHH
ncbi:hypothetical protein J6590_018026 [Homalodisca vitripennis]|nr:hypothetical protein J6590_018026 [Homalodisca vitripennis]